MNLETKEQLEAFALTTKCPTCREEAQDMLRILEAPGVTVERIVFDSDCPHNGEVKADVIQSQN